MEGTSVETFQLGGVPFAPVFLNAASHHRVSMVCKDIGSSQAQGPVLVPLNIRCCNIVYNEKVPSILRTTHRPATRSSLLCISFITCIAEAKPFSLSSPQPSLSPTPLLLPLSFRCSE